MLKLVVGALAAATALLAAAVPAAYETEEPTAPATVEPTETSDTADPAQSADVASVQMTTPNAPGSAQPQSAQVRVTVPTVFTVAVLETQVTAAGCEQLLVVTDNRSGRPGYSLTATGAGRGLVTATSVPGNGADAAAVQETATGAVYPAGAPAGSARFQTVFAQCPVWTLS